MISEIGVRARRGLCDAVLSVHGRMATLRMLTRADTGLSPDVAANDDDPDLPLDELAGIIASVNSGVKEFPGWLNEAPRSPEEIATFRRLVDCGHDLEGAINQARETGDLEAARVAFNARRDQKAAA